MWLATRTPRLAVRASRAIRQSNSCTNSKHSDRKRDCVQASAYFWNESKDTAILHMDAR
jgi:hypothetical protein